jgi:histidine triad (HIT) family protein
MADCLFRRIADGKLPVDFIWRDDLVFAVADLHPIRPGHTLIVSRRHHPFFEDLPAETTGRALRLGHRLASAMKAIYGVPRVAFAFTGGDVAHAHADVVPLHEKTDFTSRRYIAEERLIFRSTPQACPAELADTVSRLCAALAR